MKQNGTAFLMGVLFALGLGISQMTNPQKILHFLDILGNWDPTLLVVFISATGIYYLFYHWLLDREFVGLFQANLAPKEKIEPRIFFGSVLFGIGWGMCGLCPGPAITGIMSGKLVFLIFVPAMLVGMVLVKRFVK